MSYLHLTIYERSSIETLRKENYSMRAIAKHLNRSVSTISREIKRHMTEEGYSAPTAQTQYKANKRRCGRPLTLTKTLSKFIQHYLKLHWSPEQIVGRLLSNQVSFKSIYRWINSNLLKVNMLPYLRQKGKRQCPKETRGRFNVGKTISQRPKESRKRQEFGHWEADTVVSSRGKSKGCIATFAERKSRYYYCCLIPDRSSRSMREAIHQLIHTFSESAVKTITVDRGKEFSCYKDIESQFNVDIYFADPYSAWQRGTNENSNGLLREFFPKRTDLAKVTQEELNYALNAINHRPRKCLDWDTPYEILNLEVLRLN